MTKHLRNSSNSLYDYFSIDLEISDNLVNRPKEFVPDKCFLVYMNHCAPLEDINPPDIAS